MGDIGRLDQNGGHLRKLEDHERGFLNGVELDSVQRNDVLQQKIAEGFRIIHGVGLKHVQDDGLRFFLSPLAVHRAADDIRQVLITCQYPCRLAAGPAEGQDVNGTAGDTAAPCRVGMDAEEEIGAVFPGNLQTFLEGNIIIALSGKEGVISLPGVEFVPHFPADFQHHLFLLGALATHRARIFPAVPGIDDDDLVLSGFLHPFPVFLILLLYLRKNDVDDDPVRLALEFLHSENPGFRMIRQIQLDEHLPVARGRSDNAVDAGFLDDDGLRSGLDVTRVGYLDAQALLLFHHPVLSFLAGIDDDAGMIRRHPVADLQNIRRGPSRRIPQDQNKNYQAKPRLPPQIFLCGKHVLQLTNFPGYCKHSVWAKNDSLSSSWLPVVFFR